MLKMVGSFSKCWIWGLLVFFASYSAKAGVNRDSKELRETAIKEVYQAISLGDTEKYDKLKKVQESTVSYNDNIVDFYLTYQLSKLAIDLKKKAQFNQYFNALRTHAEANYAGDHSILVGILELKALYHANQFQQVIESGKRLLESLSSQNLFPVIPGFTSIEVSKSDMAALHNTVGKAFYRLGRYKQSQEQFISASLYFEQMNDLKGLSKIYNNLSAIAWVQEDIPKALEYLDNGLEIAEQQNDHLSILSKLSNKGLYLTKLGQLERADSVFTRALDNEHLEKYPSLHINTLLAQGELKLLLEQKEEGKSVIYRALDISKKIKDPYAQANAHMALIGVYLQESDYALAREYCYLAINYYLEKRLNKELASAYSFLKEIETSSGNYKAALAATNQYYEITATINKQVSDRELLKIQQEFAAAEKQKQIELLKRDKTLSLLSFEKEKSAQKSQNFLVIGFLVVLILLIVTYFSIRESKKLKCLNLELAESKKRLELLSIAFKNALDGMWIADKNLVIEAANESFMRLTQRKSPVGRRADFSKVKGQSKALTEMVYEQIQQQGFWQGEVWDKKKNGVIYPIEVKIVAIKDPFGEIQKYLGVFKDISKRKKFEEELKKLSTYDPLTGLPNRVFFEELVSRKIKEVKNETRQIAVCNISINSLKRIEESFGHDYGQLCVEEVAKILDSMTKPADILARIDKEQFGLMVDSVSDLTSVSAIATQLVYLFEKPLIINSRKIQIEINIGISVYPDDGKDGESLVRESNLAMHSVQQKEGLPFQFFKEQMNEAISASLEIEQQLMDALDEDWFEYYFQPILNCKDDKIVGAEALIRYRTPEGKLVMPDSFIPFAEKTNQIRQIDIIAIEKVFHQVAKWNQIQIAPQFTAINLSSGIFSEPDLLLSLLVSNLSSSNISPEQIKLEVTENSLIENFDVVIDTIQRLKTLGFLVAIDDFGTGYSSMAYLKQLPIDSLKVDRSFVMDMLDSNKSQCIVRNIVDLGHCLGYKIVAEGVENQRELELLRDISCEYYQGYLYSPPIEAVKFEQLLRS